MAVVDDVRICRMFARNARLSDDGRIWAGLQTKPLHKQNYKIKKTTIVRWGDYLTQRRTKIKPGLQNRNDSLRFFDIVPPPRAAFYIVLFS